MSFAATEEYLRNQQDGQFGFIQNGSCRLLALPDEAGSDDYGLINENYAPRTEDFLVCRWAQKIIDEKIIADSARSIAGYEIVVPQKIGEAEIIIKTSDRIQLKKDLRSDDFIELEIVARLDQSSFSWVIYATDADDED